MVIYLITNLINGKQYVGQTIHTAEVRWKRHCWASTLQHCCMPVTRAIRKYGKENFRLQTFCRCNSQDELDQREREICNQLNTWSPQGYNLKAGNGRGSMAQETRDKISVAHKGKKFSASWRRNLSLSHMGPLPTDRVARMKGRRKGIPLSSLAQERSIIARMKTVKLLSPSGEQLTVANIKAFCRGRTDLLEGQMYKLGRGQIKQHRSWRLLE